MPPPKFHPRAPGSPVDARPAPSAAQAAFLRSRSGLGGSGRATGALFAQARAATAGRAGGSPAAAAAGSPPPPGLVQLAASVRAAAVGGSGGGGEGAGAARPASSFGVWGAGPPKALPERPRHNPANSELRFAFERGDLPCTVLHGVKTTLKWKAPVAELDLAYYLPLFASGLREVEFPYCFLAESGFGDLLAAAGEARAASLVPLLIAPLRAAVNTRVMTAVTRTLRALLALVQLGAPEAGNPPDGTRVGRALRPFYRQLLPTLNLFADRHKSLGDRIDYGQRFNKDISSLVAQVLHMLDVTGGRGAHLDIMHSVPIYQKYVE